MYTAARMLQMKQHGGWNDKAKKPGRFPTLQSDLPVNKQARNESFSTDGNCFNLEPKQDAGPTENNIFFFFDNMHKSPRRCCTWSPATSRRVSTL